MGLKSRRDIPSSSQDGGIGGVKDRKEAASGKLTINFSPCLFFFFSSSWLFLPASLISSPMAANGRQGWVGLGLDDRGMRGGDATWMGRHADAPALPIRTRHRQGSIRYISCTDACAAH